MWILGVHVCFRGVYTLSNICSLSWKNSGTFPIPPDHTSDIPCTCISCETQTLPNLSMIQFPYHPYIWYMEYIYIYSFFLALVEFYGKWRYINIPYMEAMGVEIVVKIIDQDYNSVPGKGFRILWIWLEKQRSTKESQNTQQEIPDLWSSLLTIC